MIIDTYGPGNPMPPEQIDPPDPPPPHTPEDALFDAVASASRVSGRTQTIANARRSEHILEYLRSIGWNVVPITDPPPVDPPAGLPQARCAWCGERIDENAGYPGPEQGLAVFVQPWVHTEIDPDTQEVREHDHYASPDPGTVRYQ